jgi:hypothetical protein
VIKSVIIYIGDLFYDGRVLTGALRAVTCLSKILSEQYEVILAGTFQDKSRMAVSSTMRAVEFRVLEDSQTGQIEEIFTLIGGRSTPLFISCVSYNLELMHAISERFPEVPVIYWNHSAGFDWRSLSTLTVSLRQVWVPTINEVLRAARWQSCSRGGIRVLPNPVEVEPVRVKRSLEPTVIFIGRRSFAKGYDIFLRSAEMLALDDQRISFTAIGMSDPSLPDAAQAREWQLLAAGRLITCPYASTRDLLDLLAASWCLVLPSRLDLQPICVLEALSLGTRVVASRLAGLVEINRVTRCLTLCRSQSSLEYHDAITRVLCRQDEKSLVRGQHYIERTHSLEAVRPALGELLSCL